MIQSAQHVFNWLDYGILGVIILSVAISFFRGFIKEAVSLVIWLAAFIISVKFAPDIGKHFQHSIHSPFVATAVAFVVIFVVILILGAIMNSFLTILIEKTGMSATDRLLGIVFGLARGVLIVGIVLMLINMTSFQKEPTVQQSRLAPHFESIAHWLENFLPKEVKKASTWLGLPNGESQFTDQTTASTQE